tara:strand:- start:435 stop:830 length:396 start_codon:yes stop_codon:yes gene_type:complete
MMNEYRMRKNVTVNEDGHIMRVGGEDVKKVMTKESHVINIEVDDKARRRVMRSGASKKSMATRRCFDNTANFRLRTMSNIGIVTIDGSTIDTSRASDDDKKNGRCVSTRNDSELLSAKRDRFVEMMMKLRK